jgi:outer membrane protein assembly factor BamD
MIRRHPVLPLALICVAILAACGTSIEDDPILRLAADESLAEGHRLFAEEKYSRARPYFQHAFEVEPNSRTGREALLLVADSLFLEGDDSGLIQAEAKYRDYQNRFPTSDRAAYVQFRIAMTLGRRTERPDRDQGTTHQALEAFEDLLRLYPTTEYAEEARSEIERVRSQLAEHEYMVGRFYMRYGLPSAAASRFEGLLESYPAYAERDKALFHLALSYDRLDRADDAQATFSRLREEHSASKWVAEIPKENR